MSYDFDQHDESNDQGPKALRDALEKANKKIADLEKLNGDLTKKVTASNLSQIFADKKVPANIQRWMKRDEVEASPEAVDKWLAENGADFGWKPGGAEEAVQQEGQQVTPEEAPAATPNPGILSAEDIAQLDRLANLLGQGQSRLADQQATAVQTVADNLGDNLDFDSALAGLKAAGIDIGGGN